MIEGLVEQFVALDDPRGAGKVEHRLVDVLVIAVCAVAAEAGTFEDIALYGRCSRRCAWLWVAPLLPSPPLRAMAECNQVGTGKPACRSKVGPPCLTKQSIFERKQISSLAFPVFCA
jgi:hypothetical protein